MNYKSSVTRNLKQDTIHKFVSDWLGAVLSTLKTGIFKQDPLKEAY